MEQTAALELNQARNTCRWDRSVRYGSPYTSSFMFVAGVLGNAAALVLLAVRLRRKKRKNRRNFFSSSSASSLFQVLLTALLVTDLLGTCSVSPLVIAAYSRNESLRALGGSPRGAACEHFGFAMTFFSVVTLALLLCMALERCLSIAYPYFYERRLNARCGYLAIALVYILGALFCLTPFLGFGAYVQYCPGTWCFVDIDSHEHSAYKNLYASLLLFMIICIVLCNVSVGYHLVMMYRRRIMHRESVRRFQRSPCTRSLSEELEHLVLLAFMTITFLVCSLPLVIVVFMSHSKTDAYLMALLLLSINPILDPWVFIILSPPVPRLVWDALCKAARTKSTSQKVPSSSCNETQTSMVLQT